MKHDPNQWASHPATAPRRMRRRTAVIVGLIVAAIVAVWAVVVVSGPEAYREDFRPPGVTQQEEPNPSQKDIDSITLRAPDALGIVYADYSITNHSSKPSDYYIEFELTDASGTRVSSGFIVEDSVNPGQTVVGLEMTTADTNAGIDVKVSSVTRTASFE